jgi:hypothetical protein
MVEYGGVRYLVLTTQKVVGGESTLTVPQIQQLRCLQNEFGCQIKIVSTLDLSDETECLLFVRQACRMTSHLDGKIGGIFHLGGLLVEQPSSVLVKSLYHLDKHTRCPTVMPEYGYFVVFTRTTTYGIGLTGLQTVVDGVVESRRRECGKHGLVVDLGLLFNGVEITEPTDIHYQQAWTKLEQLLIKSIKCLLPVEGEQWTVSPYETVLTPELKKPQGKRLGDILTEIFGREQQLEEIFGSRFYTQKHSYSLGHGKQVYLMPTSVVEKLNEIEYVIGQVVPLFVVLPVETPITHIKSWAQQLKVPVFGLHYTTECTRYETVEQLAQFYWQQIERMFPQLDRFHLVGHTFGVPVAFEMALRRPQQVVSLVFLDSGLTQTFLNGRETVVVPETQVLYKFYQQFVVPTVRMSLEQFVQVLTQLPTFDERVKYIVGKIVEQSQLGFDLVDLEHAVRSFVKRMIMSCRYVPTQPLRLGKVLVVRPTTVPTTYDYIYGQVQQQLFEQECIEKVFQGLRQFLCGKLQVHLVDGEPKTFLLNGETGLKIANILNQYLIREF